MRKFLIPILAAASVFAVAAPAAAQWAQPVPQGYGYANGYNGYNGYNNNYGQVRALQVRIDQLQRQIQRLDQRNILSNREARRLFDESRSLEQRLSIAGRNGLDWRERQFVESRIVRLEQRIRYEASDGNRRMQWGNGNGQNGYNGQYAYANRDSDHDGRDDNDEHQRWHDKHDGNDDHDD